jgi:hypothetical protein
MMTNDIRRMTLELPAELYDSIAVAADTLQISKAAVIRKALARDLTFAMVAEVTQAKEARARLAANYGKGGR